MRIPTSWDDRSLLEDEPFSTLFSPAYRTDDKQGESAFIAQAAKEVKKLPDHKEIVRHWIQQAFDLAPCRSATRGYTPQPEHRIIRLFVSCYHQLSRNDLDHAIKNLNRERTSHGYGHLDLNASGPPKAITLPRPKASRPHPRRCDLNIFADEEDSGPSRKPRPNLARTLSLQPAKRSSPALVDHRPSKKRSIGKSTSSTTNLTAVKQLSADKRLGVPVALPSPAARRLRRSDRQIPRTKCNAVYKDIGITLQMKQEALSSIIPEHSASLDRQSSLKRKCSLSNTTEVRSKRHKADNKPAQESPTISTRGHGEQRKQKAKGKNTSEKFCDKPNANDANAPGILQNVKQEDLPHLLDVSIPSPSDRTRDTNTARVPSPFYSTTPVSTASAFLLESQTYKSVLDLPEPGNLTKIVSAPSPFSVIQNNTPRAPLMLHSILPLATPQASPVQSLESYTCNPAINILESTTLIVQEQDDVKDDVHHIASLPKEEECLEPMLRIPQEEPSAMPYRAPLPRLPPIWAQSRQEVCESFDWFRSYQGGVYHSHGIAKGYLLSGFPSNRDRFEHKGRLIISHGGGKAESIHSNKGLLSCQQASDQLAQDNSVRALLNNYRNKRPLALLIDDKYALFPYDLGLKDITYAVLGFYIVENAWAEYQPANNDTGRVVRYKFAFRWCEDQGNPWWIRDALMQDHQIPSIGASPGDAHSPDSLASSRTAVMFDDSSDTATVPEVSSSNVSDEREVHLPSSNSAITCIFCQKRSPRVFDACWFCLTPDCQMFWKQSNGSYVDNFGVLNYHPDFLALSPYKALPFGFQEIVTSLPQTALTQGSKNYHVTRGFHCRTCGRLSCRSQWEKWQCLNCNQSIQIDENLRHANEIWNQKLSISYKIYMINPSSDIIAVPSATFAHDGGRGIVKSFILPFRRGKIHHIQSGNGIGRKEADHLFVEYQRQAASGILKFRRWPLRAHKCRGALLTNYFSHNAGEPYKYVGGDGNTVPFHSAPAACQSRDLIQKRIKQALDTSTEFNEVLSAAYMERQKMAFHSDNEVGLGPLVAGLSLGSPALMHFRLHGKHDPDREKRGILLSIVLRHGDVLVMDGADVQEYYEHTVVPNNFRIAATARQIGSAHNT